VQPLEAFYAFFAFLLVTSREILWLRSWVGNDVFNALVTVLFVGYFISLTCSFDAYQGRITFTPRLKWPSIPEFRRIAWFVIFFCAYLLGHELIIGNSWRALKYVIYLLFFLGLLSKSSKLENIAKVFVALSAVTSLMLVAQLLLITVVGDNNLYDFPDIPKSMVDNRPDGHYVNPYGLGFMVREGLVDYGLIQFYRAYAFTTESKYCSAVLWVGVISLYYLAAIGKIASKRVWLGILGGGLLVSHAYSSIAVLAIAVLNWIGGRSKYAVSYTVVFFLVLFGALPLVISSASSLGSYAAHRIESFEKTSYRFGNLSLGSFDALGKGMDSELSQVRGLPSEVRNFLQFGYVGGLFHVVMIIFVMVLCIRQIHDSTNDDYRKMLSLIAALSVTFLVFFNAEIMSPMYMFIFALAVRYSGETWISGRSVRSAGLAPV
jgi:hypothetical protein